MLNIQRIIREINCKNARSISNINNINRLVKPVQTINLDKPQTNFDKINSDVKLKTYIKDIYKYTGYGFGGSLASSIGFGGVAVGTTLLSGSTIPIIGLW